MTRDLGFAELGDEVEDIVSGLTGVVTSYVKCLTGCDRVHVQGPVKDGKMPDVYGFDITQVKVLRKRAAVPIGTEFPQTPRHEVAAGGPPTLERRR